MRALILGVQIILLSILLSGCASSLHVNQYDFNLQTLQRLNSDANGQNSPLYVQVFQLSNKQKFLSASFEQLSNNPQATLGHDLLSERNMVVVADHVVTLSMKRHPKARFIGFVASYRLLNANKWRNVIFINKAKALSDTVTFGNDRILSVKENS